MGYNPSQHEKKQAEENRIFMADAFLKNTEAKKSRDMMKKHPNYKDAIPKVGESLCAYTLRYSANIISPPQHEGESYDVECTTIKAALSTLEEEITGKWKRFNGIF